MILLDTSVNIDFILGDKKIVSLVQELASTEEIKTTCITEYELLRHKSKLKRQLAEGFLSEMKIYPFDESSTREAATLYIELQANGKMVNQNNIIIRHRPGLFRIAANKTRKSPKHR